MVKAVIVSGLFALIAVLTGDVTSTMSAAEKIGSVPTAKRHIFMDSIVLRDMAAIPNACM